jgi:hypothetical protein
MQLDRQSLNYVWSTSQINTESDVDNIFYLLNHDNLIQSNE